MKLWDLPRGSWFTIDAEPNGAHFTIDAGLRVPPGAPPVDHTTLYRLTNIDNMYSHCTTADGGVVHIDCGADVTAQPAPADARERKTS